jgi:hypothetical protein
MSEQRAGPSALPWRDARRTSSTVPRPAFVLARTLPPTAFAWLPVSGRDSEFVGLLVAGLLAEQKAARSVDERLRFVRLGSQTEVGARFRSRWIVGNEVVSRSSVRRHAIDDFQGWAPGASVSRCSSPPVSVACW